MSAWTSLRDKVTGTVAPIVNTFTGGLGGLLGGGIGGLLGGGLGGGLMGLLGGQPQGTMNFGGGGFNSFGNQGFGDSGQFGGLMDMLNQRYPQQGQVSPTNSANLTNQGLI